MHPIPDPQARREIAARAYMPESQVRAVYLGGRRHKPSTLTRVARAAAELGYPPPPAPEHVR